MNHEKWSFGLELKSPGYIADDKLKRRMAIRVKEGVRQ
jgi:hypothetical protein